MSTLLSCENVHVNYGPVRALTGASFTLDTGRICGLIGMNGSGKSTLFKAIMGVVPAHAGTITLDGQAVGGKRAHRHRAGLVSYVPQSEEIDWTFPISVREVVSMGRYRNLGITRHLRAADRAAVDEALARVELTDLADRQIGALSGGQRKRAFVARAIAQGARLLLLDEPFAGVDKRSEAMLIQVIEQLRDEGATVLVSTHDLATLRQFADEALLLRGEILMHDTPEKVLAPENLVRAFGMEVDAGASTASAPAATTEVPAPEGSAAEDSTPAAPWARAARDRVTRDSQTAQTRIPEGRN